MLHIETPDQWNTSFSQEKKTIAINHLENGSLIYLPDLSFPLIEDEKHFLSPNYIDPHAKNMSYHPGQNKLWGVRHLTDTQHLQLKLFLARFSQHANGLVKALFPHYAQHLILGRTSFRPVEVSHRKTSYRKDDKRLHVDAFPSAPNQGKRILRVFTNINPHGQDRVWRIGEAFEQVAHTFLSRIHPPFPGKHALMRLLRITKSYASDYDHYMLKLHDTMKADERYQQEAQQTELRFPPGSSWIVQTDHVSHAAMQGQYLLEQTFYLPVAGMLQPELSPLRILEKILNKNLV